MRSVTTILTLCVFLAAVVCSATMAVSWTSFKTATFAGIDVHPVFATNTTEYTITLNPGATVTFGGVAYQVDWISGFYVNSIFPTDSFSAADAGGQNDWTWDQDPTHGPTFRSVGWRSSGDGNRIRASSGGVKEFYFNNLDLGATAVTPGFHIGYLDNRGRTQTDFFTGPALPEPSALQAGLAFLAGAAALSGRRLRRTVRK